MDIIARDTDQITVTLTGSDVARLFQAMASESRRLDDLRDEKLGMALEAIEIRNHARDLRDALAAIHPAPEGQRPCYHPLTCATCSAEKVPCGNHSQDTPGHHRCSGSDLHLVR